MEEMRNAYNIFVGKSEGKKSFASPSLRWEDNIKIYLKEMKYEVVDSIHQT
jgi:hypothetical protein